MANYLNIDKDILMNNSNGLIRPIVSYVNNFTSEIKDKGHDGIIVIRNSTIEYVVFSAKQIKFIEDVK